MPHRLRLPTLIYRRIRGDLIQAYNYIHGRVASNWQDFFSLSNDVHRYATRGHSLKLFKQPLKRNLLPCKSSFANRLVNVWNRLPESVVTAPSIDSFKARLDEFMPQIMDVYDDAPARQDTELLFGIDRYFY